MPGGRTRRAGHVEQLLRSCARVADVVQSTDRRSHRDLCDVFAELVSIVASSAAHQLTDEVVPEQRSRAVEWDQSVERAAAAFLAAARAALPALALLHRLSDPDPEPPADDDVIGTLAAACVLARDPEPELMLVMLQVQFAGDAQATAAPLLRWLDCLAPSLYAEGAMDEPVPEP